MVKLISRLTIIVSLILGTISCSEYQKVLKSSDYSYKFEKAKAYYAEEDYYRAKTILDELVPLFKGTEKAEESLFMYANCYYQEQEYTYAAYQFEVFARTYPYSEKTEEATYMAAYCYYRNSPKYMLDQTDTKTAIEALQSFINKYPSSEKVSDANELIEKLRAKLEEKSYRSAKLYYKMEDYRGASIALKNSLKEFPDTKYREEVLYLIVKSSFLLAENSVDSKKGERYQSTISEYYVFIDEYPESEHIKEIEKMYEKSVNQIKKL